MRAGELAFDRLPRLMGVINVTPDSFSDGGRFFAPQAAIEQGKPENIADRIAKGKVDKYFQQECLLEQPYIRDDSKKVEELIARNG